VRPHVLVRSLGAAVVAVLLLGTLVAVQRGAGDAGRVLAGAAPRPASAAEAAGATTPLAVPAAEGQVGVAIPVAGDAASDGLPGGAGASPQPGTATAAPAPVDPVRAAVVVEVAPEQEAAARAVLSGLEGVVHVAGVTVVSTTLGGVPADVAAVEVAEFRAFTPPATAGHQPLWDRLVAGDVAVTHEFGTVHEVPLGSRLATGLTLPTGEPVTFRAGAFATNGTPPVADALVASGSLPAGAGGVRRLLVALDPLASPTATVEALEAEGWAAEAIPDPRAPRSDTVVPAGGITPENVWDHLALCESSGDWHINTGNGYYGGVQFLPESWAMVGGQGLPHEWPREEQIYRATLLWQIQGWEAWPQCARKLGLIVDPPPDPEPSGPPQPVATEPS
jgi:hypothetical protein